MTALALAAGAGVVFFAGGAGGGDGNPRYWVELDNAFGLIEGADLKIAGVRAGRITDMKVDRATKRALVGIEITRNGFGSLRTDVFCESRPQSLIGEYFIDCKPGTAKTELKPGSRIPVERTASTIAPDLVNNILRRPYRERFRMILNELGAGVGANAENLNAAIRRANPALRETDRVLAILARQNRILGDLAKNADTVLTRLAANRKDVGRWVLEARDTARASAERQADLAAQFRKLPGFLRELTPTMAALGDVAREQTPALRDLNASASQLEDFFGNLGPFADASRPAFRSLGKASKTGRSAVRAARSTVGELRRFSAKTPELGKNLAIVLEHLDNRDNAVELDPRSPGGKGYTGLEALLQYAFDQSISINVFDRNAYILKVNVIASEACAPYADAERAKEVPQCVAALGPNQPGLNQPDPSPATRSHRAPSREGSGGEQGAAPGAQSPGGGPQAGGGNGAGGPPIDLGKTLGDLLGGGGVPAIPGISPAGLAERGATDSILGGRDGIRRAELLDYLLAP